MKTDNILRKVTFSLGLIGFIPAFFLCAQTIGMGMKTDELKSISSHTVGSYSGITVFEEMSSRYCIISVCFLLFIIFVLMRDKVLLKASGMIPLIVVVVQYGFLILLKKRLFNVNWAYSTWLEITYYMDFIGLISTFIIMILQMYLIRILYSSLIYSDL